MQNPDFIAALLGLQAPDVLIHSQLADKQSPLCSGYTYIYTGGPSFESRSITCHHTETSRVALFLSCE